MELKMFDCLVISFHLKVSSNQKRFLQYIWLKVSFCILIQIVDRERTGTYLDTIVFDEMIKYQTKHHTKLKEVSEYILEAVKRDNVDKNCATLTLDSLVERDILDKEQKMLGLTKKYPTLKFGMCKKL